MLSHEGYTCAGCKVEDSFCRIDFGVDGFVLRVLGRGGTRLFSHMAMSLSWSWEQYPGNTYRAVDMARFSFLYPSHFVGSGLLVSHL